MLLLLLGPCMPTIKSYMQLPTVGWSIRSTGDVYESLPCEALIPEVMFDLVEGGSLDAWECLELVDALMRSAAPKPESLTRVS